MLKPARHTTIALFVFCIASVYLVCQAQVPEPGKEGQAPPPSLFTAGPVEPLRNMAGNVTVQLHRFSNERDNSVTGALVGLDGNWVVVRVDQLNEERKTSSFQWIPVSNIERMIQHTVYPDRQAAPNNQLTKP